MKTVGAVLLMISLAVSGLWIAHGADLATREKVPITIKSVDDFGDEVETIEWKEPDDFPLTGFHVGLDRALPLAGSTGLPGVLLLVFGVRNSRKPTDDA